METFRTMMFLSSLFFLLSSSPTWAQETDEEAVVACPREDQIPDFTQDARCDTFRLFEFLAVDAMKTEVELFQTEVLDKIRKDNSSDPNFIANQGVLEIRKHDQCLQDICAKVFSQCGTNVKISQNYNQNAWCREKGLALSNLARSGLDTVAVENQARKEQSLLKEKLNGMSTRFFTYFHYWMPQTVNDFRIFVEKVYNFIRNPV